MNFSEGILRSTSSFQEETGRLPQTNLDAVSTSSILESSPEFLAETGRALPADDLADTSVLTSPINGFLTSGYIVTNPLNAAMQKVPLGQIGLDKPREISPNIRRKSNWIPFYIQMVDRNFNSVGIALSSGIVISSLKLTPTPDSLNINSVKMINRYNTMTRWVEDHWGDEIDTISFSGSSYSFMAQNIENIPNVGLTNKYRRHTKAYELMREMQKIFHYNGIVFQDEKTYEGVGNLFQGNLGLFGSDLTATDRFLIDPTNRFFKNRHPRRGLAKERLYINIYFDFMSAIGFFESFDIMEDETNPHRLTYSFVFKAEHIKWIQGSKASLSKDLLIPTNVDTSATQTPDKEDESQPAGESGFIIADSSEQIDQNVSGDFS